MDKMLVGATGCHSRCMFQSKVKAFSVVTSHEYGPWQSTLRVFLSLVYRINFSFLVCDD